MVIAAFIFGALALLSLALVLWQFLVAMRFPLHRRIAATRFSPDISILKPLKGADAETRACLESWMKQDYAGRVQILFGVRSPDDPVCAIVRELIAGHRGCEAELVICPKSLGPNAKVSTLVQLQRLAKYELIAVSDADVRVPGDFLAQAAAPFENKATGLVNCFYQLADPKGFGMRCEAFVVNGDFWGQVLQARSLKPIDFALGAVMITSAQRLREIAAFESLVDYLADDYQLGNRIAKAGGDIVLSPVVVECWSAPTAAGHVWEHQLRWARTIRVSQPVSYFFSILNDATLWALLWGAVHPAAWPYAAGAIAVRLCTAVITERKLTRRWSASTIPTALLCDLIRPAIWALSFLGSSVVWRGEKYRVLRGGKLVPANSS